MYGKKTSIHGVFTIKVTKHVIKNVLLTLS